MSPRGKLSWDRILALLCLLGLTWAAWDTKALYPVRILVTFLHEISHAAGAILSGGSVERIVVNPDGSGVCVVRGGWKIVYIPAGYLGSMFWGCGLLLVAFRTRFDKLASLALGAIILACCFLYVRSGFDFAFGLAWGLLLASAGWWLPEQANDLLLSFLGSASCLFALFDIRTLWTIGGAATTDAVLFSREIIPMPPVVWASLWAVAAVFLLAHTLRISVARS